VKNSIGIKKFKKLIDQTDNFIISGHENPDPDCICGCIALEYLLSSFGKNVKCINSDAIPTDLVILDYRKIITSIEEGTKIPENIENYYLIIIDTNVKSNIGKIYDLIKDKIKGIFIIDHHSTLDSEELKDCCYIDGNASSVCEMIFTIYDNFKKKMPKEVGDALYTGILFDTGSFHYQKTTPYTFYIASKIVESGTSPNDLYVLLYEHQSIEYLKITSYVLSTLRLYHNNQIAVISMPKKLLIKSGAKYDECASIINIPLQSKNIKAVVFCKENLQSVKRISMRSKGDVDVVKIATECKGGGHKNAAGFKLGPEIKKFKHILPRIITYLKDQINYSNSKN